MARRSISIIFCSIAVRAAALAPAQAPGWAQVFLIFGRVNNMQCIYRFGFETGEIYEVKDTSLPKSAPKEDRFKWYIKYNTEPSATALEFVLMTPTTREFRIGEVEVHLDIDKLILIIGSCLYRVTQLKADV